MRIGALEAGGTKMVCAIGNEQGEIFEQVSIPTETPEITIPKLIAYFKEKEIEALGIGCFGPIDLNEKSETYGYITSTPKLQWRNFDMVGAFRKALGIPVGFDTDVNGSVLGEVTFGCAKGLENVIYITIGTGVGVGVFTNGKLLHGMMHPESGHMLLAPHSGDSYRGKCPYHGCCLEGMAAGPAIEERWGAKAYDLKDKAEVWELEAYYIAQALVNYIYSYSPEKIILGGGVMHQEQLFPLIRQKVRELNRGYVVTPQMDDLDNYIVPASLHDDQGIMGALELGAQAYKKKLTDKDILFLNPVCTHNIWGGTRIREEFGYQVEGNDLGECWGISAHPNGDGVVSDGEFAGMHLSQVWKQHPEVFGNLPYDRFPLLVKIIDAKDDLSVQVHPDDIYAKEYENGSLGKTECWYVLDCPENASIVIGHNADTREELKDMIENGRWNEFIRELPVKKGDFMQIDPGTVHAITGGLLILETQQNSDITYRVYDYDRLSGGKPRELHIEKSIDVITVPAGAAEESIQSPGSLPENELCLLYECSYYKVFKLAVSGKMSFEQKYSFLNMTVIEGQGTVNGRAVKKGDCFILPYRLGNVQLEGSMEIMASTV